MEKPLATLCDRVHLQFNATILLTGRTSVGTTHERKKRLARGQFPRLSVIRQNDIHALAWICIRLIQRPETYIFTNKIQFLLISRTFVFEPIFSIEKSQSILLCSVIIYIINNYNTIITAIIYLDAFNTRVREGGVYPRSCILLVNNNYIRC